MEKMIARKMDWKKDKNTHLQKVIGALHHRKRKTGMDLWK
jgi:hypothetical protein